VSRVELTGEGGREGKGEAKKSYDGENAWSSINHSLLSAINDCGAGEGADEDKENGRV
jgi:hypothetical protein